MVSWCFIVRVGRLLAAVELSVSGSCSHVYPDKAACFGHKLLSLTGSLCVPGASGGMLRLWFFSAGLWLLAPRCGSSSARLYTEEDPLVILSGGSFSPSVTNSSSAWFIQFYSSWCGHCIQYSETWKNLARDVQDWQQAVRVGVLDCAQEENFEVCKEFNIKFYPTFKYFRAHSPETERGTPYRGADREIQSVRQVMVNILQNHTQQDWPDRCPPLRPYRKLLVPPLKGISPWSGAGRTCFCSSPPQEAAGPSTKRDLSMERKLLVPPLKGISPWSGAGRTCFCSSPPQEAAGPSTKRDLSMERSVELLPLLGQRSDHYTAIIVEEPDSYVGREVILDLLQFSGVQVKRALSSDLPLLDALKITAFPSVYLLQPNASHTHLQVQKRLRFFFSSVLRALPGVQRRVSSTAGDQGGALQERESIEWRDFSSSQVYTADLESALHYLLRVELATHSSLQGEELQVFKDLVTLVSKLYPGGGSVVKLMETLSDWLVSLPLPRIPYQAVLDLVDNTMRISGVFLGAELRWVGCQGSRAGLRGYPCALWTLFHVLTVQHEATPTALDNTGLQGEAAVLHVMRRYITTFFGCEACGRHFEQAAAESLQTVKSCEQQVLWLWEQHNRVNSRVAGSLSDDPLFPKAPWPSASLCASCHEERLGVHQWNQNNVLLFLRKHYGASNISPKYSLKEGEGKKKEEEGEGKKKEEEEEEEGKKEEGKKEEEEEEEGKKKKMKKEEGKKKEHISQRGESGGGSVWILGFNSVDMSLCVGLYSEIPPLETTPAGVRKRRKREREEEEEEEEAFTSDAKKRLTWTYLVSCLWVWLERTEVEVFLWEEDQA
ncbi:hypothetical protein NQZ68_027127 [Dissostichus eleginoides]|nr:hypothetical protein NQZ68_027127 [Dissostichus eleginoides]